MHWAVQHGGMLTDGPAAALCRSSSLQRLRFRLRLRRLGLRRRGGCRCLRCSGRGSRRPGEGFCLVCRPLCRFLYSV